MGDGLEAYERALRGAATDVLLLDWMLPGMEEQTTSLAFPTPVPQGEPEVTFTVTLSDGVGPSKPVTLPMPP